MENKFVLIHADYLNNLTLISRGLAFQVLLITIRNICIVRRVMTT